MSSIKGEVEIVHKAVGTVTYPRSGESAYQVAVNNGFIGTEQEWLDSLKGHTPQKYIDYYTEKEQEEVKASILSKVQPQIDSIEEVAEHAEVIARGRATGYVFDTLEDLETWLTNSENTAKLVLGDNLYIRALNTPDYWWDGTTKQVLETEKPELTGLVTQEYVDTAVASTRDSTDYSTSLSVSNSTHVSSIVTDYCEVKNGIAYVSLTINFNNSYVDGEGYSLIKGLPSPRKNHIFYGNMLQGASNNKPIRLLVNTSGELRWHYNKDCSLTTNQPMNVDSVYPVQ